MLNKIKSKITENKKNIAKISLGTIIGQVITIITLPIITRLYGASIIGNWALIYSISLIINSYSDLGLKNSIMMEDDNKIEKSYRVITTIAFFISLFSAFIVIIYLMFFSEIEVNLLFLFVFIIVFIFTKQQTQICYTWLNRIGNYNILTKNPIINNGTIALVSIVLGLLGFISYGYFIGQLVGQLLTLIHMKRYLPKRMFTFNIKEIKLTIKKHQRFVKFQMPTNLLSNFKNQMPTLLISWLWGSEILGYYSITVRMLQIPSTFLANAIGRVFFNITSKLKRQGKDIGQFVLNNLIKGMRIAIIPVSFLMALGDLFIIIFLGNGWEMAGDFVRILALQFFFMFLTSSVQGLPAVLDKQNFAMISAAMQGIAFFVGAVIGKVVFDSIFIGLFLMSLFFIIINISYYCHLLKEMKVSVKRYLVNALVSIVLILVLSSSMRIIVNWLEIAKFL